VGCDGSSVGLGRVVTEAYFWVGNITVVSRYQIPYTRLDGIRG
jgi:hypothetical protein